MRITIVRGDITAQPDHPSIVNAANEQLRPGAGVCGAIYKAAGDDLDEWVADRVPVDENGVRCPTGECRWTPGFNLGSMVSIFHAVGPVYNPHDPEGSATLLERAYTSTMAEASRTGTKVLAFPALSCGVYGYPIPEAARIAIRAVASFDPCRVQEVRFVMFTEETYAAFAQALVEFLDDEAASSPKHSLLPPSDDAHLDSEDAAWGSLEWHVPITAEPLPIPDWTDAVKRSSYDLHAQAAREIFGLPPGVEPTAEQRRERRAVIMEIMYGSGATEMLKQLRNEAQIAGFKSEYGKESPEFDSLEDEKS